EVVRERGRPGNRANELRRHCCGAANLGTRVQQRIAEACSALWQLDRIAAHKTNPRVRREGFQLWILTHSLKHGEAGLRAECWTDTPPHGHNIVVQEIEYSDFPRELIPLKLYLEAGTLMLPEER
ncbi:MAG: hypothetical protein H8E31_08395, partial [Planctomycetes bacterium]|nr:hypothetical protein [Planctomycetota bacterium]